MKLELSWTVDLIIDKCHLCLLEDVVLTVEVGWNDGGFEQSVESVLLPANESGEALVVNTEKHPWIFNALCAELVNHNDLTEVLIDLLAEQE